MLRRFVHGHRPFAVSLIVSALLAGCGGGGGGAPANVQVSDAPREEAASAGSDITAANAVSTFAQPLAAAVLQGTQDTVGSVLANRREGAAALAAGPAVAAAPIGLLRSALLQGATAIAAAREQRQATQSQTLSCPGGGTMSLSATDADGNQLLSAGDGLSLSLAGCVAEVGGAAANGSIAISVNVMELDAHHVPTAVDVSGTFGAFAVGSLGSLSGAFRLALKTDAAGTDTIRLSYLGLQATLGGHGFVYDFDIYGRFTSSGGGTFDISGAIGIDGQRYRISFGATGDGVFTYASGADGPSAGATRFYDAAGDALRVIAEGPSAVRFEFYPAGSTTPTLTTTGRTWAEFKSDL